MRENQRDLLILIVLGFGSVLYSLGTAAMYDAPPESEVQVLLAARPATEPRESLTRKAKREAELKRIARGDTKPMAAPTPTAAAPATKSAPAVKAADTAPVPAPTAVALVKEAKKEEPADAQVIVRREKIFGEMVEVHDFRHGLKFERNVQNFRGDVSGRNDPIAGLARLESDRSR